jgi:hypothetical protein
MKKIFSAIISSPLKGRLGGVLFALLATTCLWAYDFQSGDLYYNITSDTTVEVTYQAYDSYSNYEGLTSVVIPTFVEYNGSTYSVTRIGDDAFLFSSLTSITIPNSVANIGNYAFTACYSLDSITIPNSVISIGDNAFYNCQNLISITIPNSVTTIGSKAFRFCSSLTSILIPKNVTSIGKEAFYDCDSLTSVEWNAKNCADFDTSSGSPFSHFSRSSPIKSFIFGKEVEYIPARLCHNMDSLTSIIIPNSTTSIGKHAFQGCSFLTSVTIPNSVLSIDCQAFYKCDSLTSITIPESVISIGERAFANCDNLKSIEWNAKNCLGSESWSYFEWSPISSFTFGENVEHIPSELCIYMHSLTSITIPNSVTSIGSDAFYECIFTKENFVNNSTLDAEANNYWGAIIVDVDIDGLLIRNDTVISCRPYVTTVTIPNYITCIETAAFYRCDSLTSITIPESVTSIGGDAFLNTPWYNNLKDGIVILGKVLYKYKGEMPTSTSIDIEKGIVSISAQAFDGCRNLISIYIPETVTSIGSSAFHSCSSLASITIPNSITSIGDHAFQNCSSLASITIPNSITSIGDHAFQNCSSLTSVTIPNSVTSLGDNTFSECSSLKSVEWNVITCADFEYADYRPFENSPILSFVFGDSVEYIPAYLCYDMDSLKSIIIPESITSIGYAAFDGCSALQSVSWNAKNYADFERWEWPFDEESPIQSFTFGENVEYIPAYLCYGMDSLISVIWNAKNCADFDSSYETPFSYSPAISSFTFGENVEYIPAYLCYNMDSLKSITIPNNVDSIGEYAFAGCDSLTSATIGESVTKIGTSAFGECSVLKSVTWNVKNHADFNHGSRPFYSSPAVSSFIFGENVEYIPAYLCYDMYSLKSITIPNSVDSIGYLAFAYCDSLTSATIGNSVTSIGERAFYNCDSIKYIFSTPLLPPAIESNVFSSNVYDNAVLHVLSSDYKTHDVWKQFDSIQVADTIYSGGIRYKVITKSGELLSESLLTEESFNKFTRVSVEGTQTWRYDSQYGAKMSGFQDNITHANEDWFISPALDLEGCSSATLTFSHAFGPKSSIPTTGSQKAQYTIWVSNDFDGDVTTATWTELKGMIYGDTGWGFVSSGNITIPTENLKANCRVAWKYVCTTSSATWEIKNVSLSATNHTNAKPTLQVINGESPYSGDIVIPSVVKYMNADLEVASIGNIAFRDCSSLNSVSIENGVTTIEEYAFYNSSIAAITLPNTLTSIGYSAFSGCSTLTSISIPNSVKNLGRSAFENCVSLTTIILSNEMTILNDNTFQDCSSLKAVKLGGKLTTIGKYVFSGCLKLNEISLPASITSISENAFATCTKLYDIYCYAMEPPTAFESSFANYNAFLHVPCDNQRVYLLDVLFGNFKYIECLEAETATTDTVVVDPSFNDAEFTWPSNSDADSYTLAISKDGEVFCTLTFNANGQLTGIAFAPSRNGQHNAPAAVQAANGFTFTVTGLDEGSFYTYDLVIKDSEDNTLQSYSGEFRTQSVDDRIIMVEYDATQGEVIGAGTYLLGDIVTLTVIPNEGYQFTTWGDGNTDNPRTLVVTQDTTLTAVFEILTYNVTVTCDPIHGSVTGSGTYNHGDVVTLTATPSEGYTFVEWGDGCTDNPRALVVTQDTILTALFDVPTYNITVTCDPIHGYVTGSGTYNHGDVATLTATPSEGYTFVEWGDGCTDNPRALMVTQDTTLTAIFEILTYNVTVTCDPIHGSVTGSGTYNYGDVVTLTAIPNEGYRFVRWSNDVVDNPYTFVISEDVTLTAEFEEVIYSSVENTTANTSTPQKLLRNGQLLIIRDGKTYNAMGQDL